MLNIFKSSLIFITILFTTHSFAEVVPLDKLQFTHYAGAIVQKEKPSVGVKVIDLLTLELDFKDNTENISQLNLDRIYTVCVQQDGECKDDLTRFIQSLITIDERDLRVSTQSVRIIIRSNEYLQAKGSAYKNDAIKYPFVDGLYAIAVMDTPTAVRVLNKKDATHLNMSNKSIYQLGLANIKKELKPLSEVVDLNLGNLGYIGSNIYDPSRVLFHDDWKELAQAHQGKLIIAIPTTDSLFYTTDDSPEVIAELKKIVSAITMKYPNPLTEQLLRWTEKGWDKLD